ncbi:universal stress protein [Streptomyces indicus]|uniref:Nucleotide-binding universal stress protein, UspA family n=1 Tax=Streptomyces indicus TaxID=417292 RepID=A0A1G8ZV34_9ACTN|nr:universal stress protein [Streptomyces indicus]SDK18918.1 Nucleotide-binding universal stress protein, UspA family [Streptomyces indicus]
MNRFVIAGLDGSRESLDAADWAAREAVRRGLPLRLLHVADAPHPRTGLPELDVVGARLDGILNLAAISLSYAHPTLEIHARQHTGAPIPALVDAAREAELLVLGSRGYSGFAAFMVGSVALGVAARTHGPVALVRAGELPEDAHEPDADGAPTCTTPYRPVALGLDLTRPSDELLAYAFDAAASRGAPLEVVHAWTLPPLSAYIPAVTVSVPGDSRELERNTLCSLSAVLRPWQRKFPDTPVRERLVYGHAGHVLLKASLGASLLVIGRPRNVVRLGRAAHSVIHHVTCPVVVVPHD